MTLTDTQLDVLDWLGRTGAATAQDIARAVAATADGRPTGSTPALLRGLSRAGHVGEHRLLTAHPPLYTATRAGLRAAGLDALSVARVSPASSEHWIACSRVAAVLGPVVAARATAAVPARPSRCARLVSDRELRVIERACRRRIATAALGLARTGEPASHRPDHAILADGAPAVAVEVELTVKAPRRLQAIVRAWARSRDVGGVIYLATPRARRAVTRAAETMCAHDAIHVVALEPLLDGDHGAVLSALHAIRETAHWRRSTGAHAGTRAAREPSQPLGSVVGSPRRSPE